MSKHYFLLLILLINGCGSDLSYEERMRNYHQYVSKSNTLITNKQYKEAIRYSNSAIEISDTIPKAFFLKGIACFNTDLTDEAESNFSKVIDLEGSFSKAYKNRAMVYYLKNDDDFLDDIDVYLDNYPKDKEALLLKRLYFEKKQAFDKAINEYSNAIEMDKSNIELYIKRSALYYKKGDYENTLSDYNTIIGLDDTNFEIKEKKNQLISLMQKNKNKNIFIALLIGGYLFYTILSFFVLKPYAMKKIKAVGGEVKLTRDPLVWALPVILLLTFIIFYYYKLIPNLSNLL